jgi:hypothetical protein
MIPEAVIAADDHGNDYLSATAVTVDADSATAGELEIAGDDDYFSFDAVEGTDYAIVAEPVTLSYTYLMLYDTDGTTSITNRAYGISWTCPTGGSGTYYVRIYTFSGTGTYDFSVDTFTDDHGNSYDTATALTIDGAAVSGVIETYNNVDWFSFDAIEGTDYSIVPTLGTMRTITVYLYDTDGTTYLKYGVYGLSWTCPTGGSGTYYISLQYSYKYKGTYSITVDTYADDYANSYEGATPATVGGAAVDGEMEVKYDEDWFSFDALEDTSYSLELSASSIFAYITVYDTNGTTYLTSNSRGLGWTCPTGASGTYYFRITGSDETGSYSVTLDTYTDDHGNDYTTATSVAVGSLTSGEIDVYNDYDWFSFDALEGTSYAIDLESEDMGTTSLYMILYDTDGMTSIRSAYDGVAWTCPTGGNGTYYIRITAFSKKGTYTLNINTYTDDHGNDHTTATSVAVGTPTSGELEVYGDYDYFSFPAVEGTSYSIYLQDSTITNASLYLYDTDGTTSLSSNVYGIGWRCPTGGSGTYYVRVSRSGTVTGTYSLMIETYTDDHGNDYTSATSVTVGVEVDAKIEIVGDYDYFSFDAVEGVNYSFQALIESLTRYPPIELFDTDGTTSLAFGYVGFTWTCPAGGSGTYYVELSSYYSATGTYTFLIDTYADDHGNDRSTATAITTDGTEVDGEFEVFGENDYFSFTAEEGTTYSIQVTSDVMYLVDLDLYDANGTYPIASNYNGIVWTCPISSSGTYYVNVIGIASATSITVGGTVTNGIIDVVGEVDFFSFEAVEGTLYSIVAEPSTALSISYLRLYDKNGTSTIVSYATGGIAWTCQTGRSGTYYVMVYGRESLRKTGPYTFSVNTYTDDHGNDFDGATALTAGAAAVSGNIDVVGEDDYFSFTAEGGVDYSVQVATNVMERVYVAIYDLNGYSLGSGSYGVAWRCPDDGMGTYYVRVYGDSTKGDTGAYTVSVAAFTDDYGNDYSTSEPITPDTAATSGMINVIGDYDWFSFTATAGITYAIKSVSLVMDTLDVTLYDQFGKNGVEYGDRDLAWTCPAGAGGTYYIRLYASSSKQESGAYTLSVTSYTSDIGTEFYNAEPVTVGSSESAVINIAGDEDWFSFTAAADTSYAFTTSLGTLDGSWLALYRRTGTSRITSDDHDIAWTCPASQEGTYYVKVEGGSESDTDSGTYSLMITSYTDDLGNDSDSATELTVGRPSITGNIDAAGDNDWFSFEAAAGTTYYVSVIPLTLAGAEATLTGSGLDEKLTDMDGGDAFITFTCSDTGTYYVRVEGESYNDDTGTYAIKVNTGGSGDGCFIAAAAYEDAREPSIIDIVIESIRKILK